MMSWHRLSVVGLVGSFALLLIPSFSSADVIFPTPAQVAAAGGTGLYEIAFTTSDLMTAASPNINDYNAFVTSEANSNPTLAAIPGLNWSAIASTAAIPANLNAQFNPGIPVFNTDGQLVADAAHPLYGGALVNPINYDQQGNVGAVGVDWTGSTVVGLPSADPLGSGTGVSTIGISGLTAPFWLDATTFTPNTTALPLYALSSPTNFVAPVPEPASISLLLTAGLGLAGFLSLRRRSSAAVATDVRAA